MQRNIKATRNHGETFMLSLLIVSSQLLRLLHSLSTEILLYCIFSDVTEVGKTRIELHPLDDTPEDFIFLMASVNGGIADRLLMMRILCEVAHRTEETFINLETLFGQVVTGVRIQSPTNQIAMTANTLGTKGICIKKPRPNP